MSLNSERLQQATVEAMVQCARISTLTEYMNPEKQEAYERFFRNKAKRMNSIVAELWSIKTTLEEMHTTRIGGEDDQG